MPPSIEELRHRLTLRATDSPETIEKRVAKAAEEISFAEQFDVRIMNDKLEIACAEAEEVLKKFIEQ
jgi:guanylate kinase